MKRVKWIAVLALVCMLLLGAAAPALAADYSYTVNVSGGLHGTVSGPTPVTFAYGGRWNPNDYTVTVEANSPYYFKGFHISGQEGIVGDTEITQDTVFVASYGIKGSTVAYIVNYVAADGTVLHAPNTFYGNAGDRPVVAYIYFENYLPQAYNLTFELKEGETRTVTFTYYPVNVPAADNNAADNNGAAQPNQPAGGGAAVAPGQNPQGQGGQGEQGTPGAEGQGAGTEEPTTPVPQEIIDLDEQDVPLAGPDAAANPSSAIAQSERNKRIAKVAAAVGGVAMVSVLAALLYLLILRRRKKNGGE